MTRFSAAAVAALMFSPMAAFAGDPDAGADNFRQCASCHGVVDPDGEVFHRPAPTGPNLWGIAGRQAGAYEGYTRFSNAIVAAGEEHDLVWDEESFVAYVEDPSGYLREVTGDSRARSNMNHRLRGSAEDIFAYLSQYGD
jgi:cytochrome c